MSNGTTSATDIWIGRIGAIFAGIVLLLQLFYSPTSKEVRKIEDTVNQKSQTVIENQDAAKVERAKTAAELKAELEKQIKIEELRELKEGSQLYTNWKYLEEIGDPRAKEAKKLWDEFRAKHTKF